MAKAKVWLRDPMLQFVLIGAVLFGVNALLHPAAKQSIEVPAGMNADQQQQWVDSQVLLHEARKHGLDQADSIIARQLQLKMRALLEAQIKLAAPEDQDLRGWLDQHPQRYASEPRFDFEQVFYPRSQLPPKPDHTLSKALQQLQSGQSNQQIEQLNNVSHADLRRRYGKALADAALNANAQWSGPVQSGLGWHTIRVTQRHPQQAPDFATLRNRLEVDWREDQREQHLEQQLARLRSDYRIVVQQP